MQAILDMAEHEGAQRRRYIHRQNQQQRLLRREAHRLGGIDGRQRDDDIHAGLVEDRGQQETCEIGKLRGGAQGLRHFAPGAVYIAILRPCPRDGALGQ
jgi:hypothetical protein